MFLDKKSFESDAELAAWQLHINTAHMLKNDIVAQYMADLSEASIEVVFCTHILKLGGGRKCAIIRKVANELKFYLERYYDNPIQFLIKVDYRIWERFTDHQRKAVIHHELKHVKGEYDEKSQELKRNKKGEIVWHLVPHDKEEFEEVEKIYGGDWNVLPEDVVEFTGEKKNEV